MQCSFSIESGNLAILPLFKAKEGVVEKKHLEIILMERPHDLFWTLLWFGSQPWFDDGD